MLGVIVNTITVIIGSMIGLVFKRGIPQKLIDAIMIGIGLCTLYIGISGTLQGQSVLILIASIVLGALCGTAIDIDRRLNSLGEWVGRRMRHNGESAGGIARGFVTASLLFCIGSMTIVGSLNAGISGDNRMLYTKSLLDMVSAAMLSVSLGIGVLFSAAFVFVFQGALVLLAHALRPLLDTPSLLAEMTCAGSLLIVALGLNLIGVTRIKVANYLPAIVFAPLIAWVVSLF